MATMVLKENKTTTPGVGLPEKRRTLWDVGTRIEFWSGGVRGFIVYVGYWVVDSMGIPVEIKTNHMTFLNKDFDHFSTMDEVVEFVHSKVVALMVTYDAYYETSGHFLTRLGWWRTKAPFHSTVGIQTVRQLMEQLRVGHEMLVNKEAHLDVV